MRIFLNKNTKWIISCDFENLTILFAFWYCGVSVIVIYLYKL